MKELYESPIIDITEFGANDVILTSGVPGGVDGDAW